MSRSIVGVIAAAFVVAALFFGRKFFLGSGPTPGSESVNAGNCNWEILDDAIFTPARGSPENQWGPQFSLRNSGAIYVFGNMTGAAPVGVIRYSNDGRTWLGAPPLAYGDGFAVKAGAVYGGSGLIVAGAGSMRGQSRWVVFASDNNIAGFKVVDDYTLSGYAASAVAVAVDGGKDVFVGGEATDASGKKHWIVRKRAAGQAIWTTVEDDTDNGPGSDRIAGQHWQSHKLSWPPGAHVISGGQSVNDFSYGNSGAKMIPRDAVALSGGDRGDKAAGFAGVVVTPDHKVHWVVVKRDCK